MANGSEETFPYVDAPDSLFRRCKLNDSISRVECAMSMLLGSLYLYVFPLVFLVGMASNAWNILIFYRIKKTRQTIYLMALAGADAANLLMNGVFFHVGAKGIPIATNGKHAFIYLSMSDLGCKLFRIIFHTGFTIPTYIFLAACVDRFLAVYRSMTWRHQSNKAACWSVLTVVFCSILINMPYCLVHQLALQPYGLISCHFDAALITPKAGIVFQFYRAMFLTYGLVPVLTILGLNLGLIRSIRLARENRKNLTNTTPNSGKERSQNTLLVTISLIFVICGLPNAVLLLIAQVIALGGIPFDVIRLVYNLRDMGDFLYYCQQSINAFIYYSKNSNYRNETLVIFGRHDTKHEENSSKR